MTPTQIGRFRVGRLLGEGSQGTVYLCHDSELERKVTIKLLDKALPETSFHDEARTMSRLQHPNIVSIYEAGHHNGTPYLVFEYVEGQLLSDLIRSGALELPKAFQIFQGLLDGMSRAHQAGIVHRDLKPANIMIGAEQVPKIMDFGIARLLTEATGPDRRLIGTPRYLAPEYIARGEVGPPVDVFALGLILYEMVTGAPAFGGQDQQGVIDAILKAAPKPPSQLNAAVDEKLERFILKALEKDPALRYGDATEMLKAYTDMRHPPGTNHKPRDDASGTVEFLLRRMERKSDFPALSQSVRSINAMSHVGDKDVSQVAGVIVKDFALTSKILKVVNSAYYGRFSGRIGTVSRAVVVLGIQAIRSLAASLIFFEHIQDKHQAEKLREMVSAAMFRATLAHRVAEEIDHGEAEEYFLSGLLSDLGGILVAFYLPEESKAIEQLVTVEGREPVVAQHNVLGVSFERIGMEIARQWNFPKPLIDSMQHWDSDHKPANRTERKRAVTAFAGAVTQAIADQGLGGKTGVPAVAEKFAAALNVSPKRISGLIQASVEDFQTVAKALTTDVSHNFVARLSGATPPDAAARADRAAAREPKREGLEKTQVLEGEGTERAGQPSKAAAETADDPETLLMDGLQEVTGMLVGEHSVSEVFNVALETMYRAIGFQRVVLALLDGKAGEFAARIAFGEASDVFLRGFRFPAAYSVDVFHGALKNAVDIYVADAADAKFQPDVPEWYKRIGCAGSFLLFPLVIKGRPVGLIYADHPKAHGLEIDKKRLNLLKSLRNQVLLAVKS